MDCLSRFLFLSFFSNKERNFSHISYLSPQRGIHGGCAPQMLLAGASPYLWCAPFRLVNLNRLTVIAHSYTKRLMKTGVLLLPSTQWKNSGLHHNRNIADKLHLHCLEHFALNFRMIVYPKKSIWIVYWIKQLPFHQPTHSPEAKP